ncbi:MAG: hypothetical protein CMB29_00835 [Euryarchaeota archaeon]|nr:hypothetical protein [Euryarchaeota archaeon]|tara:strand:- start:620 stop:850 length:231 start_codon:yes stop_codon:yes gene_type:complete
MIGPIDITMRQYEDNLAFITSLTETNRCCWKVKLETGASILITPVAEVSPIEPEVQEQVEEFRKQFISNQGIGQTP